MGFLVDKFELGQDFPQELWFSCVISISLMLSDRAIK